MKNFKHALLTLGLCAVSVGIVDAQSYYEDDIYYDSKRNKKSNGVKRSTSNVETSRGNVTATTSPEWTFGGSSSVPYSYQVVGSDSYSSDSGYVRDVDEYNRRYSLDDAAATVSTDDDDFTYTRRIERFYNPNIVSDSGDDDLVDYYYNSTASQPATVNIYVNDYANPWWGYSTWNYPWTWNSWYGPSWSLSWNSAWGWNASWNWGWSPVWYPAWRPYHYYPCYGYHPHHHYWRPSPAGSHRPHYGTHRPTYRPSGRPGGVRPGTVYRPGTRLGGNTVGVRPGGTRPGGNQSGVRPGASGTRPGSGVRPGTSVSKPSNVNKYREGGAQSRPTQQSSYSRPSQSRPSQPSYSRPSSGGRHGGMSGGMRGGGGGSRGRH